MQAARRGENSSPRCVYKSSPATSHRPNSFSPHHPHALIHQHHYPEHYLTQLPLSLNLSNNSLLQQPNNPSPTIKMRFSVAAIFTFTLGALAAPSPAPAPSSPYPMPGNDVTVGVAGDTCGSEMELSCCNHVEQKGDTSFEADGILAGALEGVLADGEVDLFSGCSKLSVTALIGVSDLLNSQCKQTAACCQHSGAQQEGLVNVGLPCVALGGLL
ncbi:hypothetical protein GGR51DRAFT_500353 [Nemania sp. FL0031]|nr:hypothetical protein GGR51DRAFT_500353 [Nemania sp. FL0031]